MVEGTCSRRPPTEYVTDHSNKAYGFSTRADDDAQAELDKIKGKLAKYKGKLGKGFDDLAVDELEWMDSNKNVRAITVIFYETSL